MCLYLFIILIFYGKWGIRWRQHDIIDHNSVNNIGGCAWSIPPSHTCVGAHAQLALAMLETLGSPNPLVVRKERWWPDWGSPNLTMPKPRGRVEEYHRREPELAEDWWNWHVCEREGRRERKREKRWCGHECHRRREGVNGKRKEEPTNFGLWHKKGRWEEKNLS